MVTTAESVTVKYFSGFIRNYRALCAELGVELNLPRAEREQAILREAYKKWGTDIPSHLCGAFAFAIRDDREKKLFCFRDHVGQKQMFYTVVNGEFYCDGDINKLAALKGFEKRLNKKMLYLYLFYGYPIGDTTFYEGISKLMPGCYAEWDGSKVAAHRYFTPIFEPEESKSVDEFAEEIKAVVDEVFDDERSDSDNPYKESFLSGGVDSSYLLAAGDAVCANTVGYSESGFDESSLARRTAEILDKDFRVKTIAPDEYFDRIPLTIEKMGQPLGDASAVAFSLGCEAVRRHSRVVYSGEGIDEFFGGYNAHKRVIPSDWIYLTCSHIMSEDVVRSLLKEPVEGVDIAAPIAPLWKRLEGQEQLSKKLSVDISFWLEGDIYLNTDRTSTACGVELHTPFSDIRLFNVARRIPPRYLFMNDQNKYAFRLAASSKLPDEVAFRKKVGFPVPVREWLADSRYNKPVEEKLFGASSSKLFNTAAVRDMWERFIGGESLLWNRVYALYVFLIWYDINFN